MIKRESDKYGGALRDGMDGGIGSPLGARALSVEKPKVELTIFAQIFSQIAQ